MCSFHQQDGLHLFSVICVLTCVPPVLDMRTHMFDAALIRVSEARHSCSAKSAPHMDDCTVPFIP